MEADLGEALNPKDTIEKVTRSIEVLETKLGRQKQTLANLNQTLKNYLQNEAEISEHLARIRQEDFESREELQQQERKLYFLQQSLIHQQSDCHVTERIFETPPPTQNDHPELMSLPSCSSMDFPSPPSKGLDQLFGDTPLSRTSSCSAGEVVEAVPVSLSRQNVSIRNFPSN